jgi:hypothetical protein
MVRLWALVAFALCSRSPKPGTRKRTLRGVAITLRVR